MIWIAWTGSDGEPTKRKTTQFIYTRKRKACGKKYSLEGDVEMKTAEPMNKDIEMSWGLGKGQSE